MAVPSSAVSQYNDAASGDTTRTSFPILIANGGQFLGHISDNSTGTGSDRVDYFIVDLAGGTHDAGIGSLGDDGRLIVNFQVLGAADLFLEYEVVPYATLHSSGVPTSLSGIRNMAGGSGSITLNSNSWTSDPDYGQDSALVFKITTYGSFTGSYAIQLINGTGGGSGGGSGGDDHPGGTSTTAIILPGSTASGNIETQGDRDWFKANLTPGTYTVDLKGVTLSDTYLRLYNSAGLLIAENDDGPGSTLDSQLTFTVNQAGTYFIGAGAYGDSGTGSYTVDLNAGGGTGTGVDLAASVSNLRIGGGIGTNFPTAYPGSLIDVDVTITNFGGARTGSGSMGYYISTDPTITTADRFVVFGSLLEGIPGGESITYGHQFSVPLDLGPGTYYFGIIADYNNRISETNESNNASNGIAFTVVGSGSTNEPWFALTSDVTAVAATWQLILGHIPTANGFEYLVNSGSNPNDLSDAYYAQFNTENKYLNLVNSYAGLNPEGAIWFDREFGSLTYEEALEKAFDLIITEAAIVAGGGDPAASKLFFLNAKSYFEQVALERIVPGGVDLGEATKIALISSMLYEAVKIDIGPYATAVNDFAEQVALQGVSDDFGTNLFA